MPHLPAPPARGRLIVLAAGKAGASMAAAAERFYREMHGLCPGRLDRARRDAPRLWRAGGADPGRRGRPSDARPPGRRGHRSGRSRSPASATADDLVLVLLSGGGSANWIAPAGQLTLAEKQGITRALLRSGANIGEINTVRKHLSRIKGGRLARGRRAGPRC